jgi:hypothetical protein
LFWYSTILPKDTNNQVPFLTTVHDSPSPSAARPKRAAVAVQRQQTASKKPKVNTDESAVTIVSVESDLTSRTATTSSPVRAATSKKKRTKISLDKVEDSTETRKHSKNSERNDESRFVVDHSPIRRVASTRERKSQKERSQTQRVSVSPLISLGKHDDEIIPTFDGTDHEKLCACLDALKTSHLVNFPTICFPSDEFAAKSQFAANILKVSNFVRAIVVSHRQRGGDPGTSTASAALYVCGAPGLGKSSGVRWCCETVKKSSPVNVETKICHVNAAYLTSQSNTICD